MSLFLFRVSCLISHNKDQFIFVYLTVVFCEHLLHVGDNENGVEDEVRPKYNIEYHFSPPPAFPSGSNGAAPGWLSFESSSRSEPRGSL